MILLNVLLLIIGFVLLIKGADFFVDGSAALARHFKVPGVIIGLTIVALGTSAPELAVSTQAAIQGSNEIALSNVVGSNIFNLLCVLGVCAMIHTVPVDSGILKRDFPISIVTTILVFLMTGIAAFLNGLSDYGMEDNVGEVSRAIGAIIIALFIIYIVFLIIEAKKNPSADEEGATYAVWKCVLLIVVGLAMIIVGGQAVVTSAKYIARAAGMTETLIGLTIVAIGTSLPELVTSIVAAGKGETGLAVGNAVGSNIFNLLLILGVSAVINPVAVNLASFYDMLVLIAISMITYVFSFTKRSISRAEGICMVLIYVADVAFAVVR